MEAKVTWNEKLSFTGIASGSNVPVKMDTSVKSGGSGEGASPMELILIGLAGCTAMDVVSILEKKRQAMTAFEINVQAERAEEHPRVYTQIKLEYVVTGSQIDSQAVERAIQLSEEKYCSVHAMLKKSVPIEISYRVVDTQTA